MTTLCQTTRLLITVMTYPHPSSKYRELVCTAGITAQGEWVRLYPVNYRYRPRHQQFHKYQWITVELRPHAAGNDKRKESRQPRLDSIRVEGAPLSTDDGWRERRAIIDNVPQHTMTQLQELYNKDRTSLGIVRPTRVLDRDIIEASAEWKPEWQVLFDQLLLFGEPQKPLRKLPYKFQYVFECDDSPRPHRASIIDWELGTLFLKQAERLGSESAAAESVREKFLNQMCASDRDIRFFIGTRLPYNTWLVLGVFWPPRVCQTELFD